MTEDEIKFIPWSVARGRGKEDGLKKLFWLVALCLFAWGIWTHVVHYSPTYTFRYRLSLEVDTPEGVKSGSSVVEVMYFRELVLEWIIGPRFPARFKGEAVFVDLGGGRNVVLTLESASYLPVRTFKFPWGRADAYNEMRSAIEEANHAGQRDVPRERLPMMVTFRDLDNPRTLEQVDRSNLAATFGPGYALKAVKIEATDEPITEDIGKTLPWFRKHWVDPKSRYRGLDGSPFAYSAKPFMIGGAYLKREK